MWYICTVHVCTYACLLSYYYVDNGRTLKISVWVKNLLETDVNSRYQGQRRSSLNQGKLSQFSVVQPIDLFKKEAAFNTPMYVRMYGCVSCTIYSESCTIYCFFQLKCTYTVIRTLM